MSESVFVIDASAFVFRAYYALAPLSSKGRPSHAVSGFANTLLKLIRERQPKSCVVVFDSKKPSFRKEIYKDYKANRGEPPPDISEQIVAVMEMVKAAELPVLQDEGFEADDWIASFSRQFEKKYEVVLVSSDKDLAQLVGKNVKMLDPFKDRWIDPEAVKDKWGVSPAQMRDYQALIGDSSDNIPGLPGVGPKTATKLLNEYKTIEGIKKNLDKLAPKLKKKFEDNEKILELSRELVSLREDLEVPFKKVPLLELPLSESFREFLVDWDCSRTLKQFPELVGGAKEAEDDAPKFKLIESEAALSTLQKQIQEKARVSFDCETNSFNRDEAKLVGVSFCLDKKEAFYLPVNHGKSELSEKAVWEFLQTVLEDPKVGKTAHNGKYDIQILSRHGIEVEGFEDDTMIMAYLLHADRRSVSLDNLARDMLGAEKGDLKKILKGSEDFSDVALDVAVDYAARDAWLTESLRDLFEARLKKEKKLSWVYRELEMPLVLVLARMESMGVLLDCERLEKLSKEMHSKLQKIEAKIYKLAGHEFNIASPKQLQKVLFEEVGLEPIKKTKTGYSTDESVLTELAREHEIPELILEQRQLAKLTSTYVDVLPKLVAKSDARLHTHYHQTGTATGRLSSSEPNLQNIPSRREEGMKIREAFIPEDGYEFFSADYSQIELRLMAHFSEDKKMIKAFRDGRDIHSETAKLIFGSDDKEHRSRAKAINFGIIYGISPFGLSRQLGIERSEAKDFIDAYFEQFPGVKEYMEESVELGRKQGYTETLFGRKRPLPDIKSKNPTLRQMAERIAINAPLQGTAADVMKWAMIQVDHRLREKGWKTRLLLQVHDELVLEVYRSEKEQIQEMVVEAMMDFSGCPGKDIKVPLVVDSAFGPNWAKL